MKLHGLQETLDTLWKWMGEAEATMTENEAQPVGDSDLATVEQQLAEHEVSYCHSIQLFGSSGTDTPGSDDDLD